MSLSFAVLNARAPFAATLFTLPYMLRRAPGLRPRVVYFVPARAPSRFCPNGRAADRLWGDFRCCSQRALYCALRRVGERLRRRLPRSGGRASYCASLRVRPTFVCRARFNSICARLPRLPAPLRVADASAGVRGTRRGGLETGMLTGAGVSRSRRSRRPRSSLIRLMRRIRSSCRSRSVAEDLGRGRS